MTDITPYLTNNALLAQLMEMGGPVMAVLLVIALLGLIAFVYLMLLGTLYAPRLNGTLKKTVIRWQQDPEAVSPAAMMERAGRWGRLNPLLHLVSNTMTAIRAQQDSGKIRETATRDAQQALEPFEAPLKVIEVIAALAPLLGLLGTVLGMMEAFSAMAAAEGRANASQLSGGIYEALITTAAGLVVAIPFAALAAWVEFRLRRIHQTINSTLVSIFSVAAEPQNAAEADTRHSTNHASRPRFAHATG